MKTYHDIAIDGGSRIAEQVADQNSHLMARLADIDHIVAVMSGKGGVGKSMTTVLLATELARQGRRTAIVDADINGASQVQMTGVARWPSMDGEAIQPAVTSAGVQVMSIDMFLSEGDPVQWQSVTDHSTFTWRGMVEVAAIREMLADTAWDNVDALLIDLPPGTDKLPNLLDLVPTLSAAIVVTIPSRVSEYVVTKSVEIARSSFGDRPIGLIENMTEFVCDGCGKRHAMFPGGNSDLAERLGLPVLGRIPFDPLLSARVDAGQAFDPSDVAASTAEAIREAARRLAGLLAAQTS